MNKKNKNLIFIITATIFLVVSIFTLNAAIPGTKHEMNTVLVDVGSYTMGLQEAVDGSYLKLNADAPTLDGITSVSTGHDATQIWVSVDGTESTLQGAINGAGLCGSTSVPYIGSINPGHLASEIEIEVNGIPMTLQQAIDSGEFCCTSLTCAQTGCGTHDDECGGTLDCGSCCTSHSSTSCYNGDVYWYDSCGVREERKEDCQNPYSCSAGSCVLAWGYNVNTQCRGTYGADSSISGHQACVAFCASWYQSSYGSNYCASWRDDRPKECICYSGTITLACNQNEGAWTLAGFTGSIPDCSSW